MSINVERESPLISTPNQGYENVVQHAQYLQERTLGIMQRLVTDLTPKYVLFGQQNVGTHT